MRPFSSTLERTGSDCTEQNMIHINEKESNLNLVKMDLCSAKRDIEFLMWSMGLYKVRRYHQQKYWTEETRDSDYAQRIESYPKLESVAEHSWHVADAVMVLGSRFSWLNHHRCLELAIIHDKLEIITGDINPIGRDGTGDRAHAFNHEYQMVKKENEEHALTHYLRRLDGSAKFHAKELFSEYEQLETDEAKFVKAVDKLQTLIYITIKKQGKMDDNHIHFTIKYALKAMIFPDIKLHLNAAKEIFYGEIAKSRKVDIDSVKRIAQVQIQQNLFE